MPWCDACSRYLAPTGLDAAGRCPACGGDVGASSPNEKASVAPTRVDLRELAGEEAPGPLPWHFKLMLVMLLGYLGWRVVQIFV